MAGRDIAIECNAEPDIIVNGEAALLISLVQNLVTNAVKYGRDDGHVWVNVYSEGPNACVSVRDDGVGISEEDLDRIWNRFYQADRSRSDESRGIGLGLSLARQIARRGQRICLFHAEGVKSSHTAPKQSLQCIRHPGRPRNAAARGVKLYMCLTEIVAGAHGVFEKFRAGHGENFRHEIQLALVVEPQAVQLRIVRGYGARILLPVEIGGIS